MPSTKGESSIAFRTPQRARLRPPHSHVLRPADGVAVHLGPVNRPVELLVDEPAHDHVVAPHEVQPVLDATARLVAGGADYALDRGRQHQVCVVVEGFEAADESPAVGG
jgi:hypothetical protein